MYLSMQMARLNSCFRVALCALVRSAPFCAKAAVKKKQVSKALEAEDFMSEQFLCTKW
jgi:hypothetical protein